MLPVLHLAATLWMTGLIWFVQVVHYPLLAGVGADGFVGYHARHRRRTGCVVGPPMLLEALSGLVLAIRPSPPVPAGAAWAGLALIAVIWLSTAAIQVPAHRRLERGFDAATHRRLVRSNWIRTAAWTARSALLVAAFATAPSG